ncbi:MAG: PAS domain-containing protein [Rhizomicrobium sp.]
MDIQPNVLSSVTAGADEFNAAAKHYRWPGLCDPTCKFFYAKHRDILALWRSLAGSEGIPFRREMTARRLQPYLKSILLYERVEGGHGERRYRVRLMGSKIVQVFGEFTGKCLDEVIPANFLPRWEALPDAVLRTGAPVRFLVRSDTFDKAHMVAEYFCAPLRADDGEARLVWIVGHYDGTLCWTELHAAECKRLGLEPAVFI